MSDQKPSLSLAAIMKAHAHIARWIRHTPLLYSDVLSHQTGAEVWFKPECWQLTGSFKVRGALHRIGLMDEAARTRGVVTGSAGNHGLGVAYAARIWDQITANIFVPTTAPRSKIEKMRYLNATVHEVGKTYEEAHQAAESFSHETGATYISAYDEIEVIAGQGTVGIEVMTDLPAVDMLLVPVGGGGLIAGIATVVKAANPLCQIIGVQPQASPAALLSLRDGVAYDPYDHEPTIADGLAGGFGAVPFAVASSLIDRVLLVSETALRRAVYTLLDRHQLVVEASGAIAIAPLLDWDTGMCHDPLDVRGKNVACVLTGGNIDTDLLYQIMEEHSHA